ncbi:hypothetical protein [Actomonas aquatica]|uniref:Uncharacterized protein n=1 Tax=Actomonas aquatica TaxID=2866162 RepID=A0ABZ1C1Q1_9BACT|nr:hypothetical protein [Opitutus sp. WL0086]WRQ85514.1 hypothetical protein K1X11_011945 [Opitutus sp. WL0086]
MNSLRSLCFSLLIVATVTAPAVAETWPDIGSRRELFVDRALVESMDGVRMELARPRDEGPVLIFEDPWDQAVVYTTVIKDGGVYRLYYRGGVPAAGLTDPADIEVTCYAESTDGIHWRKPELNIHDYAGRKTNIILPPDARRISHNFSPMLDDRPGVPASQRYKAVGGRGGNRPVLSVETGRFEHGSGDEVVATGGLQRLVSADGIHWEVLPGPALFDGYALDSLNVLTWLPEEEVYAVYLRTWTEGGTPDNPGFAGYRTVSRATSRDFIHWSKPEPMSYGDAPPEHIYTNATTPYFRAPHLLIALPFRFWPERRAYAEEVFVEAGVHPGQLKGVSDAVLMTSRGGTRYDRTFMQSFIRPGRDLFNWHARNNAPAVGVVPTDGGDTISFYTTTHYTMPSAQLRRYTLRPDGFAAVRADYAPGSLLTKPFRYTGDRLNLNFATSAAGFVQVELLDADGIVLARSDELIGDDLERIVTWSNGTVVAAQSGQPVRLRFTLQDADLYAFQFQP